MSSMELMKQVKKAEQEAEEIRKKGIQDARDLISNAEDEVQMLIDADHKKAREQGNNLIVKAEAEAQKAIESLKEKNHAESSAIIEKAQRNLDKGVSFVLERIVKQNGRN